MGSKDSCPMCDRKVERVINYGTGGGMTLDISSDEMVCIVPKYDRAVIH